MKKKVIANIIMVAVILVIVAAGVLVAGHYQGWFDKDDGTQAVLTDIRGIVNMERGGVTFAVEEETVLREGDRILCTAGATAVIRTGDGTLTLANSAKVAVVEPKAEAFAATVESGEVFASTAAAAKLTFDGREVVFQNTAAFLSVRSGAQSVGVFYGTVEGAQAGQQVDWVNGEKSVGTLAIESLNDFTIVQVRNANKTLALCFTDAQLDKLEADRWAEKQAAATGTQPPVQSDVTEPTVGTVTTTPTGGGIVAPPETTAPPQTTTPPETTAPPTPQYDGYVTITIRCDTILNNYDKLDPAKAGYVPASGTILPVVTVGFNEGETVFDVLSRACTAYGIQLEYSWTPLYNSYYIEGVNHLYEFDCGEQSGWMYKVNGWFPNYGCSSYYVEDGDTIVWCYTCVGLGADVGGGNW